MKRFLLFILVFFTIQVSYAEKDETFNAYQKASAFFKSNNKFNQGDTLINIATDRYRNCLIFRKGHGPGFVIVSNNAANTIIAYSFDNFFKENEATDELISDIDKRIGQTSATNTTLRSFANPAPREAIIGPLLSTKWGQSTYLNEKTPVVDGEHCITGCVATALAQVMNYYQWPKTGYLSKTYNDEKGCGQVVTANFEKTKFDWDNMVDDPIKNKPNQTQIDAMSDLLFMAGVSVQMTYSTSGSSSNITLISKTTRDFFKYADGAKTISKKNYSDEEWWPIIKNELDNKRPVIYAGTKEFGNSHAFVLDGYDNEGYVHVNWGWYGACDGYFSLSMLDPYGAGDDNYKLNQEAVIGLYPNYDWTEEDVVPSQTLFSWIFDETTNTLTILGSGEMSYIAGLEPWAKHKESIEKVVIGEGITTISQELFKNCTALKHVVLHEGLKTIGAYAFAYSGVEEIDLPNSLEEISMCGLIGTKLQNLYIPKNVKTLTNCFEGCDLLSDFFVDVENPNFSSVDGVLYDYSGTTMICFPPVKEFTGFPSTLKVLGESCFHGSSIDSCIIPEGVTLSPYVFDYCKNLKRLKLPQGITEIPENLCGFCESLTYINIPEGVTKIGVGAFSYCKNLEAVYLPSTISEISNGAFSNCSKLKKIVCRSSRCTPNEKAFKYVSDTGTLIVPTPMSNYSWDKFMKWLPQGWTYEITDFTGLETIPSDAPAPTTHDVYNLHGQKIGTTDFFNPSNLENEIYIIDGKKYLNK